MKKSTHEEEEKEVIVAVVEQRKIQRTKRLNKLPILTAMMTMMLCRLSQRSIRIPEAHGLGLGVVHPHHARRHTMSRRACSSLSYASTTTSSSTSTLSPFWQQQQQQPQPPQPFGRQGGCHHSRRERCRAQSRWASTTSTSAEGITSSLQDRVHESLSRVILPTVLNADADANTNTPPATVVLLVLVSGGCDSVGLLHALMAARKEKLDQKEEQEQVPQTYDYQNIHVVHFDHEQRGAASDGDRELVRDLCRHYDLPFYCYYWNEKNHDHDNHIHDLTAATNENGNDTSEKDHTSDSAAFSQDAARQWRRGVSHELVQRLCRKASTTETNDNDSVHDSITATVATTATTSVGIILTAHHQDDSNETLLLKVLRGAHLTNLRGMDMVVRVRHDNNSDDVDSDDDAPVLLDQHSYYYWARPLLTTSKTDIVDYLQSNQWTWRQDASNATPKYRRNRIRNELLPLLADVVGGEDALQRRLDHLVEQSQELHEDLTSRARAHLDDQRGNDRNGDNDLFLLPSSKTLQDVVHKQAFYLWVQERSNHQFAYEHLQRICAQLKDYPNRQQWRLNIGDGWDIVREGTSLRLAAAKDESKGNTDECRPVDWVLANTPNDLKGATKLHDTSQQDTLQVLVPREYVSGATRFFMSRADQTNDLGISPPWRKGRSPIKVTEFLRGQKVALHERKQAQVVYMEREGEPTVLVAVYVATKAKWIIDARFDCDQELADRVPICLKLE